MSELWDEPDWLIDLPSLDGEEEALGVLGAERPDGFLDTVGDAESVGLDDSTGAADPISVALLREYMHAQPETDSGVSILDDGAEGPTGDLGVAVDAEESGALEVPAAAGER